MKKLLVVTLSTVTALVSQTANAAPVDANTLFYCQAKSGKHILVQQDQSAVTYMFGKNLQKPEIVLRKPNSEVEISSGNGAGANWSTDIEIPNGAYLYSVSFGQARPNGYSSTMETFGSVTAIKNGKTLATVECKPSTIQYN